MTEPRAIRRTLSRDDILRIVREEASETYRAADLLNDKNEREIAQLTVRILLQEIHARCFA
jgi:hypothetical protein